MVTAGTAFREPSPVLFYGNASQFLAECIGVATNVVAIGILGFIVFKLIDVTIGLRVRPAVEAEGLDLDEMGVPGYVGVVDNLGVPELSGHGSMHTADESVACSRTIIVRWHLRAAVRDRRTLRGKTVGGHLPPLQIQVTG